MRYLSRKKQQGIALIVVMLVVALVVIIAASMTGRLQLLMSRSINQQAIQQGLWSALAGEQLVYNVLEQDYKDSKDSVHLAQLWAREGMVFPVGNGMLSGEVQDLHSCFNLNALAQDSSSTTNSTTKSGSTREQFEVLLRTIGVENYIAEQLASTIKDWVDSDSLVTDSLGAEDDNYRGKIVPYLAPNSLMVNITELMAVEGMTGAIYRKIRPYVCLVPSTDLRLNINTISTEHAALLTAAFNGDLDIEDAKSILNSRDQEGFSDVADFLAATEITALGTLSSEIQAQFEITSNDFRALLIFRADEQEFTVQSVFQRDSQEKLAVISRQFGAIQ